MSNKKNEFSNLPFSQRLGLCSVGIFILLTIGFFWFYLYGSYFTILGEPAPITPLYAEGWIYPSIWIFSFIGIVFSIVQIVRMVKNYNGNAYQYTRNGVIIELLIYLLFLIVTPTYTIQLAPQIFGFTDIKGEYITNVDTYLFWVDKLGYSYVKGYKYQTLDDAIKGLEFAKSYSNKKMYDNIFYFVGEEYGYEEVFRKYEDDKLHSIFIYEKLNVNYGNGEYEYQKKAGDKFLSEYSKIFYLIGLKSKDSNIQMVCDIVTELTLKLEQGDISKKEYFEEIRKVFMKIYEKEIFLPSLL